MSDFNKIKAIIIDDELHWQTIIHKMASLIPELSIEGVFSEVEPAYDFLIEKEIDLIFLDVQINGDNGIEMIKRLHKSHQVIIISSSGEFALDGFDISAIDYLKKPLNFEKFNKAVQKAIQQINRQETSEEARKNLSFDRDYFLIKEDQAIVKISHNDVLYITALENYIKIITPQKKHLVLTTLLHFERSLTAQHPFLRVHRSYLVNLNCIKTLNKDNCVLINEVEIPIGDIYRNEVQAVFVEGKMIKR